MHRRLIYLYLTLLASRTITAFPYSTSQIPAPRQNNSSSFSGTLPQPTISTTILSPNNTNLTPSFLILLYFNPLSLPNNTTTATTNNTLSPRQPPSRRPINFCTSPTSSFLTSFCKYSHGRYSPLQDYVVYCQDDFPPSRQHQRYPSTATAIAPSSSPSPSSQPASNLVPHHHLFPPIISEDGACDREEICVDGAVGEGVAYCVSKSEFGLLEQLKEWQKEDDDSGGGGGKRRRRKGGKGGKKGGDGGGDRGLKVDGKENLAGKVARMVISGQEGVMPMQVAGMQVKAGIVGKDGEGYSGSDGDIDVMQERNCEGCFEIGTARMGEDTDFLGTEARVMAGGTAAAAAVGVVWLVVSG